MVNESEINAARDLGIPTYLYDPGSPFKSDGVTWHEQQYYKLQWLIEKQKGYAFKPSDRQSESYARKGGSSI